MSRNIKEVVQAVLENRSKLDEYKANLASGNVKPEDGDALISEHKTLIEEASETINAAVKDNEVTLKQLMNMPQLPKVLALMGGPVERETKVITASAPEVKFSQENHNELLAANQAYIASRGKMEALTADQRRLFEAAAKFDTDVYGSGGIFVPTEVHSEMIRKLPASSVIMDLITVDTTMSPTKTYPMEIYESGTNDSAGDIYTNRLRIQRGVGKKSTSTQEGNDMTFGAKVIECKLAKCSFPVPRTFFEDSQQNPTELIATALRESIALDLEYEILNNTSADGPAGIIPRLTDASRIINVGNPVTADLLRQTFYKTSALPPQYRGDSSLVIGPTTMADFSIIKNPTSGDYVLGFEDTSRGTLNNPNSAVWMRRPVYESRHMPTSGAGAKIGIWADFKQLYTYLQRIGLSMYIWDDPRSEFIEIIFRWRDGGDVLRPWTGVLFVQS